MAISAAGFLLTAGIGRSSAATLYRVTVVRDCVQCETDQARSGAMHNHGRIRVNRVYDSKARRYAEPKTTEQNRIVRTGKSEAEVTNIKDRARRF